MSEVVETTARRERTRQRLLDAAAQVFAETGLDAASVEAICEAAGFTRGAFYSNFDSKDELFLQLASQVSNGRLEAVSERVRELEQDPQPPTDPAELVTRLLDIQHDDRLGVLLLSEIRNHALRDAALAASYGQWEDAMIARVARIIDDIGAASGLDFQLPPTDLARLFLNTWESAAQRAVMDGLDNQALCASVNERIRQVAGVLVGSDPRSTA